MPETIDLVPEDEDAVEVTVRLPRAAARAAEAHDLMPLAELIARAAATHDDHEVLLLLKATLTSGGESLPWRPERLANGIVEARLMQSVRDRLAPHAAIPLPLPDIPDLRRAARISASYVSHLQHFRDALTGLRFALVPIQDDEPEQEDWEAKEAQAEREKRAGQHSETVSGEEFLTMLAGEAGMSLDDVLADAGVSRKDI
ncbi:hypothetical protein [Streptomyces erythrochromogenes]|uniref:hypothetical protein n=1 Tax=Streptomyces erythrochromogenes TaxID=285574 RepID=UPI0036F5CD2B